MLGCCDSPEATFSARKNRQKESRDGKSAPPVLYGRGEMAVARIGISAEPKHVISTY